MQKETKILSFVLLGLLFTSFLMGIVSAETLWQKIVGSNSITPETFNNFLFPSIEWTASLTKIMLLILVVLIIYSISSFIPFMTSNNGIQWAISIIIGLLSVWFINPGEISYILTNYQALGIALTTVIPLVILLAFVTKLRSSNLIYAHFIEKVVFTLFGLYVLFSWLNVDLSTPSTLSWMYPVTLVIVILWLIFGSKISGFFKKEQVRGEIDQEVRDTITTLEAEVQQRIRNRNENLNAAALNAYDSKTARLQQRIAELTARLS